MAKLVSAVIVVAVVLLGTWVTGGLISDDFETAFVLNGAFFLVSGVAAVLVARRRPSLRLPVLGAYAVAALAVGGFLAYGTFVDRVVDEGVAMGSASAEARFRSLAHETTGRVRVVGRELQLLQFQTDPGPDLRVYLTRDRYDGGDVDGRVDLGALKGNKGTQRYDLPIDAPVSGSVVIWCRAFSVAFGAADFRSP